jgi:hypothetical protein
VFSNAERVEMVEACRYADEVLGEVPLVTTVEFCKQHGIDLVTHGDDFTSEKAALHHAEMIAWGRYFSVPNNTIVSTINIIKRVLDRFSHAATATATASATAATSDSDSDFADSNSVCGTVLSGITDSTRPLHEDCAIERSSSSSFDKKEKVHLLQSEEYEYEGDVLSGKRHGKGKCVFLCGRFAGKVYEGEWKEGKMEGVGKMWDNNGNVYEGEWENGKRRGKGVMRDCCGNVYQGDWRRDERHGDGAAQFGDGDTYVGGWRNNRKHGRGVYRWSDGSMYEGEYVDDLREGKGVCRFSSGLCYKGMLKEGMRHGNGVLKDSSGNVLEKGKWENDEFKG